MLLFAILMRERRGEGEEKEKERRGEERRGSNYVFTPPQVVCINCKSDNISGVRYISIARDADKRNMRSLCARCVERDNMLKSEVEHKNLLLFCFRIALDMLLNHNRSSSRVTANSRRTSDHL